jgi:hypothetical protein
MLRSLLPDRFKTNGPAEAAAPDGGVDERLDVGHVSL